MHLGLRLLFGFLAITGLAAFFVLRVFVGEVEPSTKEVMEDLLVDTANLLAEVAAPELATLPEGGLLGDGPLALAARAYRQRPVDAAIWDLRKRTLDLRILVTDARGRVVFDSGSPPALQQDYSRWRDVARTLRGEYGARTSPDATDAASSVMHVAAPVRAGDRLLGVLVVAKPMSTVLPFVRRAQDKILLSGALLLGASLVIGIGVTAWAVVSVRRLRDYARSAATDTPLAPPALAGELGDLARAMAEMRARLLRRDQLEHEVRALTHELKSPLAAIRGAAELLQEELDGPDRQRFAGQVEDQARRLQHIVEQMLELSKLESLPALPTRRRLNLRALTGQVLSQHDAVVQQRGLRVQWLRDDGPDIAGDGARLSLALSNLLANALAHAPAGSTLQLAVLPVPGGGARWCLRDQGPGVPDYARARLGERFFAMAPDGGGPRGSGLGLAIVAQVVALHGGSLRFEDAAPGLRVCIDLPPAGAPGPDPG